MAEKLKGMAKEAKAVEKAIEKEMEKKEAAAAVPTAAQAVTTEGKVVVPPEEKKPEAKKRKVEEKFEEKLYTINLRRAFDKPLKKRARTAVRVVRKRLERALKRPVALDMALNMKIWERGAEKPPRSVRVKARVYEKRVVAGVE